MPPRAPVQDPIVPRVSLSPAAPRGALAPARGRVLGLLAAPRRASTLPLLAGLLGLAAASAGLFRLPTPELSAVPAGNVALVNQRPILQSDFISQTEAETSAPFAEATKASRRHVLDEMIDEELMVQRSLALDLPENDIDVRHALVTGVEAQVSAPLLAAPISDDALRAFYRAHRLDYATQGTMRIRNIVLHVGGYENADQTVSQADQDAAEAAYQLRSGANPDDVMQHFGFVDAPNADPGDQYDFAAKLHLGPALFALAQTMNSGDVSDPVPRPDGVHLLLMNRRQPPRISDFEHVRGPVLTAYKAEAQSRLLKANLAFLRRNAQILLAPDIDR